MTHRGPFQPLPFCDSVFDIPEATALSCDGFSTGSGQIQGFVTEEQRVDSGIIYLKPLSWSSSCSSMFSTHPELVPLNLKQDTSAMLLLHRVCLLGKVLLCVGLTVFLDSEDFEIIEVFIKLQFQFQLNFAYLLTASISLALHCRMASTSD